MRYDLFNFQELKIAFIHDHAVAASHGTHASKKRGRGSMSIKLKYTDTISFVLCCREAVQLTMGLRHWAVFEFMAPANADKR